MSIKEIFQRFIAKFDNTPKEIICYAPRPMDIPEFEVPKGFNVRLVDNTFVVSYDEE